MSGTRIPRTYPTNTPSVHASNQNGIGPIPLFDAANCSSWRLRMQNYFEGACLWRIVHEAFVFHMDDKNRTPMEEANMELNSQSKSIFIGILSRPNFDFICQFKMDKEILDALNDLHIGSIQVCKDKSEFIRCEL